jgi:hypothetical protein
MKPVAIAVPNSVCDVFYEIENLHRCQELETLSCRLLKLFYVSGWEDGIFEFDRAELCRALRTTVAQFERAATELERRGLVIFRSAGGGEAVEVLAMSSPSLTGVAQIGWWQYYHPGEIASTFTLGEDYF